MSDSPLQCLILIYKLDFSHLKSLAIDLKAIFVLNNDLKLILALSKLCLKEI